METKPMIAVGDVYLNDRMSGAFVVEWIDGNAVGMAGDGWTWTGRCEDMRRQGFFRPTPAPRRQVGQHEAIAPIGRDTKAIVAGVVTITYAMVAAYVLIRLVDVGIAERVVVAVLRWMGVL